MSRSRSRSRSAGRSRTVPPCLATWVMAAAGCAWARSGTRALSALAGVAKASGTARAHRDRTGPGRATFGPCDSFALFCVENAGPVWELIPAVANLVVAGPLPFAKVRELGPRCTVWCLSRFGHSRRGAGGGRRGAGPRPPSRLPPRNSARIVFAFKTRWPHSGHV